MASRFTCQRRVEFRDTDAAGIAHFSSFFSWMEQAEHEALRGVGIRVLDAETGISWPRVSARCDYRAPAYFEDELNIDVCVEALGSKSVTYRFDFRGRERSIAEGQMTTVCCRLNSGDRFNTEKKLTAVPIPPDIAELLKRLA